MMVCFKKYALTLSLLILISFRASAQPEEPDAPTPFGFIEVLIAAGALYGGKKAYHRKKGPGRYRQNL